MSPAPNAWDKGACLLYASEVFVCLKRRDVVKVASIQPFSASTALFACRATAVRGEQPVFVSPLQFCTLSGRVDTCTLPRCCKLSAGTASSLGKLNSLTSSDAVPAPCGSGGAPRFSHRASPGTPEYTRRTRQRASTQLVPACAAALT